MYLGKLDKSSHVYMVAEVDYYSNVERFNARSVHVFSH